MKKLVIILILAVGFFLIGRFVYTSFTKKPFSPAATENYNNGSLKMSIDYSRPSKRDRVIFGGLVPYGEVWRTGANEATEITINKDVYFGSEKLKAGRYALFTIPEEQSWTVILNSVLGQWGHFTYDAKKDVLRVKVPVQKLTEPVEMFKISFEEKADSVLLSFIWDQTKVSVPIKAQ
jgi:hypothetical protein